MTHIPIPGPATGSDEWLEVHYSAVPGIGCITASQAAAAIGEGEFQQPRDIYCLHRGLIERWEGNEMAARGHRFEPYLIGEYEAKTGNKVKTNQPLFRHPEYDFIGVTPDGMLSAEHGFEGKICNGYRAKELGEEGTDHVFRDWICQCQQGMGVMGAKEWTLFVMVGLHEYRTFHIKRNDKLIDAMFAKEAELWDRIQRKDPPEINVNHRHAGELVKRLYGAGDGAVVDLDEHGAAVWHDIEKQKAQIKAAKALLDRNMARFGDLLGDATIGRLPDGEREVCRIAIAESLWSQKHIDEAENMQGEVKRKGHVRIQARKVKV